MGLTNGGQGYERREIDEIRADLVSIAQNEISSDVGIDDTTLIGQFQGAMAYDDDSIEKLAEAIYYSIFISSSTGDTLDRHGLDNSIFRKPAAQAVVTLQIDSYVGEFLESDSSMSTADGVVFKTVDDVTFDEPSMVDDPDKPGSQIPLEDDDGTPICRQTVTAVAEETGIQGNIGANQITYNVDGNTNIFKVTNPMAAEGGQEAETDMAYSARLIANNTNGSPSTEDGMKTAIENTPGVVQARVVGNNTLKPDQYGNPAKSTHLYVIGGTDQTVAEAFFHCMPEGTLTVGEVASDVINKSGDVRTVKFSRAVAKAVLISIQLTTNDDFDSDNGIDNIKKNLITFFSKYRMGDQVLFSQIFGQIWLVPGISNLSLKIGTDKDNLALEDIAVNEFELPSLSMEDVEVTADV
ncbi:Phage Mu gp47 related protein [Levilactobacillus senmaizukei DSM 21775 = NBRC 103853]|uniref:Phage Mu gp47 related protein n=1 Tax=Levilactobacillus senmaizukei DSM 21775 = NBRC 103853 TaxID=1423803 RepID=A0A0R2DGM3_9LACO|nr:baseplate J/gp47 family protein [Levilactobacillus senmaizukei]KRN02155.1 Phage Mu gp47 related protein [Levilactobacillus senmaizukei DSM 21775 = NBRC 103853]